MTWSKASFKNLFNEHIKREGADEFWEWLISTDFFEAPASTRYHGSFTGGLFIHSLNVWHQFIRLAKAYPQIETNAETAAIITLLHDVCKVHSYKIDFRNVKDSAGRWGKVPYFTYEELFPYGNHGAKSVFLISKFIKLTDEEAVAIQCHMGNEDGKYTVSRAYEHYPLAWLLHVADEAATYLDEKENN